MNFRRRVDTLGHAKLLVKEDNHDGVDIQTFRVTSGSRIVFYLDITELTGTLEFTVTNAATEDQTFKQRYTNTYSSTGQFIIPITELQRFVRISTTSTDASFSISVSAADNSTSEEAESLLETIRDNINGERGTFTDRSGSAATTSAEVAPANSNRKYFFIQNVSNGTIWFDFGTAAVTDQPSIELSPGDSWTMKEGFISTEAINVISESSTRNFTAKEG